MKNPVLALSALLAAPLALPSAAGRADFSAEVNRPARPALSLAQMSREPAGAPTTAPSTAKPSAVRSNAIPFRPPTVLPGWGPEQQRRYSRLPLRPAPRVGRDLMFRDEDRDTFQAVHPFLLAPVEPLDVSRER